jgi:WD40 repeat protein
VHECEFFWFLPAYRSRIRLICVILQDIPARSGSCITSLTSEQVAGDVFVAGFGDGAIRIYDRRLASRESMVKMWKDHKSWIVKVHMQRGGMRELVSGSATGEVKLWDIRMESPIRSFLAHTKGMRSLGVHEHAPVIATYFPSALVWMVKNFGGWKLTTSIVGRPTMTSKYGT